MKVAGLLQKLLLALVLGVVCLVFLMQEDSTIQTMIGKRLIAAFESAGECRVQGAVERLNLFSPYIVFKDVVVRPKNATSSWHWQAERATIAMSWWHFLRYGSIDINVILDDVHAASAISSKVDFFDHISALGRPATSDVQIFLQGIDIHRATFEGAHTNGMQLQLHFDSHSKSIAHAFKTRLFLYDGTLADARVQYLSGVQGNVTLDAQHGTIIAVDMPCKVMQLPSAVRDCRITGTWQQSQGDFLLVNHEKTFSVASHLSLRDADDQHMTFDAHVPARTLAEVIGGTSFATMPLDGLCDIHAKMNLAAAQRGDMHGHMTVATMAFKTEPLACTSRVTFNRKHAAWKGGIVCTGKDGQAGGGTWGWDEKLHTGFLAFTNTTTLAVPLCSDWEIKPKACVAKLLCEQGGKVSASMNGTAFNKKSQATMIVSGSGVTAKNAFTVTGKVNTMPYEVKGSVEPWQIQAVTCMDAAGKKLLDMQSLPHDTKRLTGVVSIPVVRDVVQATCGYDIQGQGELAVRLLMGDTLTAQLHLKDGTIRLPRTYNFINSFDAVVDVDYAQRSLAVSGVHCGLHRGSITCDYARVVFDKDYRLSFVYAPLLMHHCLLNFHKDLFAVLSGHAVVRKQEGKLPYLQSKLIIEQAQLKENILSDVFQKDLFYSAGSALGASHTDIACDITIETQDLIRVKTSFLETQAKVALTIGNTLRSPEVSGSLQLVSGTLFFPYQPLYITRGSLYFLPHQLNDPVIEFVAKNKIKKYNVSLHVTGSLANHTVRLEASPPLTEQQIVALLLVGSTEESLSMVMPTLIMNNITNLLFGKDQANVHDYFKNMLRPFKYIHLVPSFTDHTGRGGLRGAVEIDVNDRWHALVQKNFSLSEDTRVEVEYMMSDDVSLRGIRDERRDLGAEVEMKWKF